MDASSDRKKEIQLEFNKYDKDGSGSVSVDEAHAILSKKLGLSSESTKKMVEMCDQNNDGQLSYTEFVEFYFSVNAKAAEMKELFESFDADKSGSVSAKEAVEVLCKFGFSEREVKSLVHKHDDDEDGELQYEEFLKFWNYEPADQ